MTDTTDIDPVAELEARCADLERQLADVKKRAESGILKAHLQAEAARAGMVDLDGLKMLDLSQVSVADDGEVHGIALLMDQARKQKPWLFAGVSTSAPGGAPPSQQPRQKTAMEMSDAEYRAAKEAILKYRR